MGQLVLGIWGCKNPVWPKMSLSADKNVCEENKTDFHPFSLCT